MPFGAAVAVFVLVVAGAAVFTLTRGDGLTEEQRVGRAAVGQNDALQRQNYADYQRYTCSAEQGTEANMFGAQQESVRQHGARYVDDVTAVTIDGDRALKYLYEREIPLREGPQRQRQHPADVCKAGRAVEGLFGVPVTPCGRLTT